MNGLNDTVEELRDIYPEIPRDYLFRAVLDLVITDDFLFSVISNIESPSRGKLAVFKKRIERFSHSRRNKEVEKFELLENFVIIKNAFKEQIIETVMIQDTVGYVPFSTVTGSYQFEKESPFQDGFTNSNSLGNLKNFGIDYSMDRSIYRILNGKLKEIEEISKSNHPFDLFSIGKIIQIKDTSSNDLPIRNKLLNVIKKDISIRNKRSGKDIIANYEEFMKEVSLERENNTVSGSDPKLTKFSKYTEAIAFDEIDMASKTLDDKFFGKEIRFEEYIKKKNMLYEYANNLWK